MRSPASASSVGPVVLVTNAPRPHHSIRDQLRTLGVPDTAYDAIVSSGDVTRTVIAAEPGVRLFHLGPERDRPFYEGLDVTFVSEEEADLVSCTGLFDDNVETPDNYRARFERPGRARRPYGLRQSRSCRRTRRPLDLLRGALARLYEELGGEAILVGKPHAPIYDGCAKNARRAWRRTHPRRRRWACRPISAARSTTTCRCFSLPAAFTPPISAPHLDPDGERVAARLESRRPRARSPTCRH